MKYVQVQLQRYIYWVVFSWFRLSKESFLIGYSSGNASHFTFLGYGKKQKLITTGKRFTLQSNEERTCRWIHTFSRDSLGLVEVHDPVDDLHRGVPAEEGDLVGEFLGGGVWSLARLRSLLLDVLRTVWVRRGTPMALAVLCRTTTVFTTSSCSSSTSVCRDTGVKAVLISAV